MIYRSNLTCPDLTPHFKHLHSRVMPHSMGHDVPSDWADKADDDPVFGIYKKCGMWTHDEAAILYSICYLARGSPWADIGCHTGWTTAHIGLGVFNGSHNMPYVEAVDPILALPEFRDRLAGNMNGWPRTLQATTSQEFFDRDLPLGICSAVIDGDHQPGKPLEDAEGFLRQMQVNRYGWRNVVVFHDGIGAPVREAVTWLLTQGFKARIYWTPHIVFCCWRGDFKPPDHVGDPTIDWEPHVRAMEQDFDFGRLS